MGKELWEKYWTTDTIRKAWDVNNDIDRTEDAESIARKFRWILKDKIKFSIEEISWFKAATRGNHQYYVFNRAANVPELMNELFEIFSKEKKDELISIDKAIEVERILSDILPIYEEESEPLPADEIQDCLIMLNKISNFNIFKNEEFNDTTNMLKMLDEINSFISNKQKEIDKKEMNDSIKKDRNSKQEMNNEYFQRRQKICNKVKEFYTKENDKKYFEFLIYDTIKNADSQKCYELICRWSSKWLSIIDHIKWLREAEDFYNMYELFEVHEKIGINKIKINDRKKCFEKINWSSSDVVKAYEQKFLRIGIKSLYEYITSTLINEELIPDEKIRNEEECLKEGIIKIETL